MLEKGEKTMKRVRKVMALLLTVCTLFAMSMTTFATADSNPAVAEARNGVIQVRVYYIDDMGKEWPLQNGSGFLLGTASGATTLITNYHVVSFDEAERNALNEYFAEMGINVNFHNSNELNVEVRVAVKRDVEIVATYVNGSEDIDFAILELAQPIYDRAPLKVRGSSELTATQQVYALGFPAVQSWVEDDSVYTTEDVTVTGGIINKLHQINEINYVSHSAKTSEGNSGGPLVDSTGAVVGVNTISYGEYVPDSFGSIAIDEVASILDMLGIPYEKADPTPVIEDTPTVDNTQTTEDNVQITEDNTQTTEDNTQTVEDNTQTIVDNTQTVVAPVEEGPNWLVIGGIAGGVVLLLVIVLVVLMSSKKKKPAALQSNTIPTPPPVTPVSPVPPVPPAFVTMPMDTGAGETSVLGGGAGETSVLGGGSMQPTATLIRKKNGETATLTKPMFIIGKERQKVDFCVPDNNSVSRKHANIVCKGGVYYVVDNNSTNYTFVNGNKINPNQEVKLNSGDKIKLADEEFEFRM